MATIRRLSPRSEAREIGDVVRALFVSELLSPSGRLYLVAPWLSDAPVLDNQTHAFDSLGPSWSATRIRLTQVVGRLAELGCESRLVTLPHPRNTALRERLRESTPPGATAPVLVESDELGERGFLGDRFFLFGPMNWTDAGMTSGEDGLVLHTDPRVVAEVRRTMDERWGEG